MTTPLRIGIAGAQAGSAHAQVFAQNPGAALTALADSDRSALDALGAQYPDASRFDSVESMISSGMIDAVVISTPAFRRERHVGAAFDAGLHVLCDAPTGINGRETSHIFTSAGLVGKTFMWSNPMRFDPRQSVAQALVASGDLGEVYLGHSRVHASGFAWDADSWRHDGEYGGGALLQAGFEALDSVWFAMGCPEAIEAMAARSDILSKEYAGPKIERIADDSLAGLIRFKTGASLQISLQASGHGPAEERMAQLWGTQGSLDLLSGTRFTGSQADCYAVAASPESQYTAQAEAFVQAIANNSEPLNTGKQALTIMKMIDALATSAHEKEAVPIKAERSLEDLFGPL